MRIRRKDHFLGRWIPHATGYPTWFGRLCRVGAVRVDREVNEEYNTTGKIGFIQAHLLHYPFMKGLTHWFDRQNRYSSMEAELLRSGGESVRIAGLVSRDPAARRIELKKALPRLPGRPFLVFTYLYFIRFGFLNGLPGLYYCLLRAHYELMISLKSRELAMKESSRS